MQVCYIPLVCAGEIRYDEPSLDEPILVIATPIERPPHFIIREMHVYR